MTAATTTSAPSAGPTPAPAVRSSGLAPMRLIKAELLKIWTTNSWWIFGILALAFTALALLVNTFQANFELENAEQNRLNGPPTFGGPVGPGEPGPSEADIQRMRDEYFASIDVARILIRSAANIYTSGQYFGLLFMVILGALIVTNEFFHQTATTTFLATPRRTQVILSKLAAGALLAVAFWFITTVIDLGIGAAVFGSQGHDLSLGEWSVIRSILMNLLAYVIWVILGVGLGVLIRSQLGATLTGAAFYLLSYPVAFLFFSLIRTYVIQSDWVWNWIAAVPGVASGIMISPERMTLGYSETGPVLGPEWWVGAIVLVGYGAVAATIGTLITRKRDIS